MNPTEILKRQHHVLEELFHEIALARDLATRAEILSDLRREVLAYNVLEGSILRRAAATAPRELLLWEEWEDRLRVERVALALDGMDPAAESFAARVTALQDLLEDRIEHAETQLFPKLERLASTRKGSMKRPGPLSPEPRLATEVTP